MIIGAVLGVKLTNEPMMNSNLNVQKRISGDLLKHQVSDISAVIILDGRVLFCACSGKPTVFSPAYTRHVAPDSLQN